MDGLEEYEEETKDLEFLAGINHVIETHKNDPTPRPYRIAPNHPDLVQHDDAPGFWSPEVTPEERQQLLAEIRQLKKHQDEHVDTHDETCHWCQCECRGPGHPRCTYCTEFWKNK